MKEAAKSTAWMRPEFATASAVVLATAAVAVFCLVYTALAGASESVAEALLWAAINVAPFVAAFGAGLHRPPHTRLIMLAIAIAASVIAAIMWQGTTPWFELVRRLPTILLLGAGWWVGDRLASSRRPQPPHAIDIPRDADWIEAAGNYVVAHRGGATTTHRATLAEAEASLTRIGFVRVHRSALVRRAAIARVRDVDVVLRCGVSVRTGARYRAGL